MCMFFLSNKIVANLQKKKKSATCSFMPGEDLKQGDSGNPGPPTQVLPRAIFGASLLYTSYLIRLLKNKIVFLSAILVLI
jgi:hypothetical protein